MEIHVVIWRRFEFLSMVVRQLEERAGPAVRVRS